MGMAYNAEEQRRDLDKKIEEVKEAVRGANEVLKDLRAEMKKAQGLLKRIDEAAEVEVSERMAKVVKEGLEEFGEALSEAIDRGTEKVFKRFDEVADLLLGEDRRTKAKGWPSIKELAQRMTELQEAEEEGLPARLQGKRRGFATTNDGTEAI